MASFRTLGIAPPGTTAVGDARDDPEFLAVLVVDARVLPEPDLLQLAVLQAVPDRVDRERRYEDGASRDRGEGPRDDQGAVRPALLGLMRPAQAAAAEAYDTARRMSQATRPEG